MQTISNNLEIMEQIEMFDPELIGLRGLINGEFQRGLSGLLVALDTRLEQIDQREAQASANTREYLANLILSTASNDSVDSEDIALVSQLASSLTPTHQHTPLLQASAVARIPAWLHGEAGSGKSTAADTVADQLGLESRSISLCPTTTKSDLLGYRDANGQYRRTAFRQTFEDGGVFLFDEIDNAHPSSLALINHALANGIAEFPDKKVEIHPDTIIIAAANTIGRGANAQYVGRAVIDAATLDRFVFIPWNIDESLEDMIVTGSTTRDTSIDISAGGIPTAQEWLSEVRDIRELIALSGIRHLCSTRAAIYGSKLARLGVGREWLREMTVFKGMPERDRKKVMTARDQQ